MQISRLPVIGGTYIKSTVFGASGATDHPIYVVTFTERKDGLIRGRQCSVRVWMFCSRMRECRIPTKILIDLAFL